MENENKGETNINLHDKFDQTIESGNELVEKTKDGLSELENTVNSFSNSVNNVNDFVSNVGNLGNVFLESKKISSQTTLGLKTIEENHKTINKNIDNEYKKQNKLMKSASEVIDQGLSNNNIEYIREGLAAMIQVANHNPMADLKRNLDEKLNKNFEDDDFYLEI